MGKRNEELVTAKFTSQRSRVTSRKQVESEILQKVAWAVGFTPRTIKKWLRDYDNARVAE